MILVILVVSLASIIVINLAYSTYIGARINASVERSLQAEYLLKSALNLARVLISQDKSREDSPEDAWMMFMNGMPIPAEMIGLTGQNIKIELEIRPENSKIPLSALKPPGKAAERLRQTLVRLMEDELKFDEDKEEDQTEYFKGKGRVFSSKEMLVNLVDYQMASSDPFEENGVRSVRSELPADSFPGQPIMRIGELAAIPGFTPLRVQKLSPFVTAGFASSSAQININSAPLAILRSLDESISGQVAEDMDAFRHDKEQGPFKSGDLATQLSEKFVSDVVANALLPALQCSTTTFQVVAKVDYGTSSYFLRAYLDRAQASEGSPPEVRSMELF